MPAGQFTPSRIHLDYPEWTPPAVGDTGKPWVWNNTTQKYEQVSGVTFASGVASLATALVSPTWRPASDSTTALKIQNAAGTVDVAVANTTDGYFRANTLLVNTSSPNDNSLPYKMVVALPGGLNDNGGVMITSNQNANAYKALLSVMNYGNTITGGYAKTTFLAYMHQNASVSSTQNPDGTFVNLSFLAVPNLTTVNQNLYSQASPSNPNVSTSGENINAQSYFYVQGSAGQQTKINSAVGYRSRGQLVVTNAVVTTMTDFHSAPFVNMVNGVITTRYGVLIDFDNTNITNAYGIYQSSSTLKNYFAGPIILSILRPLSDSTTAVRLQNAAGTADVVTVNTVNGATSLVASADEVLSLKSSLTTQPQWKFWHGTPGNFEGYLKIGTGINVNNWELALIPGGGGNFKNAVTSPAYRSAITGRGDSDIVQWVNAGGNFNGVLKLGQQYNNGTFGVTTYIGQVTGSDFKISNNIEATLFGIDYAGKIKTNQAVTNANTPSGATSKAIPLYDAAGSLLGYIPIYANQW